MLLHSTETPCKPNAKVENTGKKHVEVPMPDVFMEMTMNATLSSH